MPANRTWDLIRRLKGKIKAKYIKLKTSLQKLSKIMERQSNLTALHYEPQHYNDL